MKRYFKEESKKDWYRTSIQPLSNEELSLGCQMRIAKAMEIMAQNHAQLISERDRYKTSADDRQERIYRLERRISAYQGVITKLKKGQSK